MRDPQVFLNMFRAAPFLLISAIGMTFVILSGGIDLSVGGVVALTTVVSAALLRNNGMDPWLVMVIVLLMGMAFGVVMGFFITYLKVQPFIATLAGLWVARGLCFFISDNAIPIRNRLYEVLAGTKLLIPGLSDPTTKQGEFVSIMVVFELVFLLVAIFVAHYTGFGRTVYAIGGNELSARLMGLPVNRTKMLVYTLNGLLLGAGRHRAEHRCRIRPRPVRDGHGADRDRGRRHRRHAADRRRRLRVRDAVRGPDHRRHPDPHPVQRTAQLVVDADRRRRPDARVHRRPELPVHRPAGTPVGPDAPSLATGAAAETGAQDGP